MNEYADVQELQLDDQVLRKFIRANYRFMSLQTFIDTLEVTPEYMQEVLTPLMFSKIGTRITPSIIILHAQKEYDEA